MITRPMIYHTLSLAGGNHAGVPGGLHPRLVTGGWDAFAEMRGIVAVRERAERYGVSVGIDVIHPFGRWPETMDGGGLTTFVRDAASRLGVRDPHLLDAMIGGLRAQIAAAPHALVQVGTWPAATTRHDWLVTLAPFIGFGQQCSVVLDNATAHAPDSATHRLLRTWDRELCGLIVEPVGRDDTDWNQWPSLSLTDYFEADIKGRRDRAECAAGSVERLHAWPYSIERAQTAWSHGLAFSVALDRLTTRQMEDLLAAASGRAGG